MPFSDTTEYPRGHAYGDDVGNSPLIVAPAGTKVKVSSIVLNRSSGSATTYEVTNAANTVTYFSGPLLQLTSFEIGPFLAEDGLRIAAGITVGSHAAVFYFST